MTDTSLLVVDWDFFFPNPMENGGHGKLNEVALYDWGHRETPLNIDGIWPHRAAGFFNAGQPLPQCQGFDGFWDRFRLTSDARLYVADSNVYAIKVPAPPEGWKAVWLYDAHHDAGYRDDYEAWLDSGRVSCEDWMLDFDAAGAELHVRYPSWRSAALELEPEPLAELDRALDDGTNPDVVFDAVFVCRSGAWVPPWCDDQFTAFLAAFPHGDPVGLDEHYPLPLVRDFDIDGARQQHDVWQRLLADVQETGSGSR